MTNKIDTEIWNLINKEKNRQINCINLIASENYVSSEVMLAQGSCLTNKYAEGYVKKRFYSGCKYIDKIEKIAQERAKQLFNVDYANVQPHSGSQANYAVFQALLNPGDTILGMNLTHGGHLTHGSKVNFSGKIYNSYFYNVEENGDIDYKKIHQLAKKYSPKMIIAGFSSYSGILNWKKMKDISDDVKAYLFVDISHVAGLIIAGLYPNPLDYAHVVSTTTHKTLGGPRGGLIISRIGDKKIYNKLDSSVFPGSQGGPLMHVIAAKAISFNQALSTEFKEIQHRTLQYSKIMLEIFVNRDFNIAFGKNTNNHLFIVDLSNKKITGKFASEILEKSNILVNKNVIPNDLQSPFITSGIRIGTPAIAKRGIKLNSVIQITNWIIDILENPYNKKIIFEIKKNIEKICKNHPINM